MEPVVATLLSDSVAGLGTLLADTTVAGTLVVGIVGALFFTVIKGVRKFMR